MRRMEPWWTCNKCGERLVKVGKGGLRKKIDEHRRDGCGTSAGAYIVQVEQQKQK